MAASRHALRLPEGPLRTVAEARIAASHGEDLLAVVARAEPERIAPSREVARLTREQLVALYDTEVEGGRVARAIKLAELAQARWPSASGSRSRLLRACAGVPKPELIHRDLPDPWRNALRQLLLARAGRDVAFLRWASTPETWVRSSGTGKVTELFVTKLRLSWRDRLRRAQAYRVACESLRLKPDYDLRRGINALPGFLGLPIGPDREQACGILVKASARGGARQPSPAGRPLQEYLDVVLTLDPKSQPARYFAARERFRAGNLRALTDAVGAVVRCPHLNRFLQFDLLLWAAEQRLKGKPGLWAVRGLYPRHGLNGLARVVVAAAALESEGTRDRGLLAECYQDSLFALGEFPALPATTAHALLALRTDHLDEARDALARTLEAFESPVAEFYSALLLMREGAKAETILAHLRRAKAQRFGGFDGDTRGMLPGPYPEVKPYLRLPTFRGYFRLPD